MKIDVRAWGCLRVKRSAGVVRVVYTPDLYYDEPPAVFELDCDEARALRKALKQAIRELESE